MARRRKLSVQDRTIINRTISLTDEEVIEEFIHSRRVKNVRETTIQYYLDVFQVLNRDKEKIHAYKQLVELNLRDFEDLIMYWKGFMKVNTINSKIKAFKTFYSYSYAMGYIENNPCKDIQLLRKREEIKDTLDINEVKQIANYFKNKQSFSGFRDLVLFQLLLDTGIRISEAVNIQISDIKSDYIVIVQTKNLTQRIVYISNAMKEKLQSYLKIRGDCSHQSLFINQDNLPYSKNTFQDNLRKAKKTCHIDKQISPHSCRRTYAKNAILNGMDAFSLAALLGHSSLEITKRYVQIWGNDLKKQAGLKKDYGRWF